jgi:hypothetical protein
MNSPAYVRFFASMTMKDGGSLLYAGRLASALKSRGAW